MRTLTHPVEPVLTADLRLFGVSAVQAWFYFSKYTDDPWYLKSLVHIIPFSHVVRSANLSDLGCRRVLHRPLTPNPDFPHKFVPDTFSCQLLSHKHIVYLYVIANFANPLYLVHIVWSLVVGVLGPLLSRFSRTSAVRLKF
jgi:hypothetical protein